MNEEKPRARVLLVDDDRTMLSHLSSLVSEAGHEPHAASTWTDALRLFREARPDLVLLDVMMPTIDGYKLAKMIKADAGSFVPVILLTALGDVESKRRGMAAGADDFLSKPVSALELEIRIQSMLRIKVLTDQLREANARLAQLAVTDPLTGLPNRRSLYQQLEREFVRSGRYRHPMSVLMIDIDHFKRVNDTWGHQIGDRVLKTVADVLKSATRNCDVAGRFGGEEFLVLAPETGRDAVAVMCERIRSRVETESAAVGDGSPPVTISLGAASTDAVHVESVDELVHAADAALYEAKRGGRNRTVVAGAGKGIASASEG